MFTLEYLFCYQVLFSLYNVLSPNICLNNIIFKNTFAAGQYYGCPLGWLAYEGNCYLIKRTPATWLEAQAACRQEGGALASVSSELENKFVWSQLPKGSSSWSQYSLVLLVLNTSSARHFHWMFSHKTCLS